jgi:DNA-binding GntR family transcriptional regulator
MIASSRIYRHAISWPYTGAAVTAIAVSPTRIALRELELMQKSHVRAREEHSTVARIVEALKRDLISGAIGPDTLIVESQIGARFGVSKTPAREALVRLSEMGFVSVIPGRGYTVTKLSWQQIKDLFEVRMLIEASAAELAAARAGPADVAAMQSAARLANRSALSIEELLAANLEFHSAIWKATRNARLVQIASEVMDDLMRAMHTAMLSEDTEQMVEQHLQLAALIEQKKAGEARTFMIEHVDATRRRLLEL